MKDLKLNQALKNWIESPLSDLLSEFEAGTRPKGGVSEYKNGVPSLGAEHLDSNGGFKFDKIKYVPPAFARSMNRGHIQKNDILVVKDGATTAKTSFVGSSFPHAFSVINEHLFRCKTKDSIEPKYIFYYLFSRKGQDGILSDFRGAAQGGISKQFVDKVIIPVAPPEQQKQIVAKIEELFSHIDAGIDALKQSQKLLKQYRQSVLKAAVTGELSKEWREQHKSKLEPASKLLERILVERRQKWEAQQLEQFKAKGKMPKDDEWKKKYKEASAPDTSDLKELPEGWCWVSLDSILFDIKTGKSFRCDERPPKEGEVGVVKVSAVSWGHYLEEESKTCVDKKLIRPEYFVRNGDFLFSRANTIELVGACVIVERTTKDIMLSDKILRFDLNEDMKKWILSLLRSKHGRSEIESLATGNQDSMRNIGQDRIKSIRVPMAGNTEIKWISDAVESRLSSIDEIEKSIDSELQRSERLKQSVLQSAFSGELQ